MGDKNVLHYGDAVLPGERDHSQDLKPVDAGRMAGSDLAAQQRAAYGEQFAQITRDIKNKLAMALPTQDKEVKKKLREYGLPICLFGEGAHERRERLRSVLQGEKGAETGRQIQAKEDGEEDHELFYTEGTLALKNCRVEIAKWSLKQAKERLGTERKVGALVDREEQTEKYLAWIQDSIASELSQVADERPLTQGKFSCDGNLFATGGWTGLVKLWSVPDGEFVRCLRADFNNGDDQSRCHGLAFNPVKHANGSHILASAMADGKVMIWNSEKETPEVVLGGHEDRANRVAFHPMGKQCASTSHDQTWRLWDLATQKEILLQEGHSAGVYGVGFHPDGSLLATTDLAAVVRLWDMRTGRAVMHLPGHHDQVLAVDFSPLGYTCATASDDHTVRVWDLRKRKCAQSILAHGKSIPDVRFDKTGTFLLTASYDKLIKLWSTVNYQCKKVLVGHEARVMGVDLCQRSDGQQWVGSVSYNRTFKLWGTSGKVCDV